MQEDLRQRVLTAIERKYGYKEQGTYLRQIKCPACDKKEAYSFTADPWVIKCAREKRCGAEHHVKDLFPELFNAWTRDYPKTPANPHASADAYLTLGRGFKSDLIKGWYTQGAHHDREHDFWTSTVKFTLPNGATFERFIDDPARFGSRKGTLSAYRGYWWCAPSGEFANLSAPRGGELWLTEGIFNAIALMHVGITAVSTMSSGSYPDVSLSELAQHCTEVGRPRPTLVWALDSDAAGRKFIHKHIERARADGWVCEAAQLPTEGTHKQDWNDYLIAKKLTDKVLDKARFEGALLICNSKDEKGLLIHERYGVARFVFEFRDELFWYEMKDNGKSEPMPIVSNISTCVPTILYKQSNLNTDEHWFYFNVEFPHAKPYKLAFTNAQIASAAEFKKRLLVANGGLFTGTTQQLDAYIKRQMRTLKTVETIDFVGYTPESSLYIFGDVAVKAGKIYKINNEDFFEIGRQSIKTLSNQHLQVNTDMTEFERGFFKLIYQAYGARGLVALTFWFGSLFAEQIRAQQESFPFLELVGEPGTGKSTLIAFLWRLVGRKRYEGFDPNKASVVSRRRNMIQYSNMPTVFLESDRSDDASKFSRFDWDELKTAYNGGIPYSTGQKNIGNSTYEPPFRGSVVISQNKVVKASTAVLERIVHIYFEKKNLTPDTQRAAYALTRIESEQVSGFLLKSVQAEAEVMSTIIERQFENVKLLECFDNLRNVRVIKNHAQILACWDAMRKVFPELTEQMHQAVYEEVAEMAQARERALDSDHPLVQEFWEVVEHLESQYEDRQVVNHSMDSQLIAINLMHFESVAAERKIKIPLLSDLRDILRTSRRHRFIDVKTVGSAINKYHNLRNQMEKRPATVKCWVFER